jgi:hypothetical protein
MDITVIVYFMTWAVEVLIKNVKFEVLRAPTVKSTIFWVVTSFSQIEIYRRFRGIYCFHLHSQRVSQMTTLLGSLFDPEDEGNFYQTTWCCIPEESTLKNIWNLMEFITI